MSYGEVDFVDLLAFPVFLLGGLQQTGIMDPITFEGYSVMDVLVDLPATDGITVAMLLSLGSIAVVLATNRPSIRNGLSLAQYWVVVVMFGLIVAPPFIPIIDGLIESSVAVGFVALLIQSAGYMLLSWLG